MATGLADTNMDWQNFYVGHLTADITSGATDIFIDTIPTPTESMLVIDPDTPANTEVIFYNSKTATKVTTPANGRGYDGSTAVAHQTGTKVILAPVGDMFRYIRTLATTTPQGWTPLASAPNTVTANGNRSYTCVFNGVDYTSTLSPGMRLKTTRTVAAPTQSTSLNGTTQYWSKTSPAGMTFTDNFVVSSWVKMTSYGAGNQVIASRYNGTSGWHLTISASGQVYLEGFNGSSSNVSEVNSYQSIPLNKWVHIAAQLNMAAFTATTTTSYVMIDGVNVPASVARTGTNPTSLVQAGNLEIGSQNGGLNPFPGKIAQVAIYGAAVSQATILASMHQGLAGTETSLISAYSFNGNANDLNANANNLTANGSAVATNADSPFGGQASGLISSTLDYGIVTSATFSTNTTLVVQVPEGCTIPTSGGVSAVSYASVKAPYGMPVERIKWRIASVYLGTETINFAATSQWSASHSQLSVPIGSWSRLGYQGPGYLTSTVAGVRSGHYTLAPTTPANAVYSSELVSRMYNAATTGDTTFLLPLNKDTETTLSVATTYTLYADVTVASGTESWLVAGGEGAWTIFAELAYL